MSTVNESLALIQLVEKVGETVDDFHDNVDHFGNWSAGSATGGPNGDGLYPLPVKGQPDRLVPCPAKIAAIAEQSGAEATPLTAEVISNLATAAKNDIGGALRALPTVPGVDQDGNLVKVPLGMFVSRRTADKDVLQGSEFAEWLDCLSSSGQERKIAVSALRKVVGEVIDPTQAPYNVVYDYKKMKPSFTQANTNTVTVNEAVFTNADIGKLVNAGGGRNDGCLIGYIGQVVDAKTIRLFTDLTFSTPANANVTTQNEMVWGTDNTVGMQRALDDAEPVSIFYTGRVVLIGGMALVRSLRFGSIAMVGLAGTACGFAALSTPGSQSPFIADKTTGRYATLRPDGYTIKGLSFSGQRYTAKYSEYRRTLEINGGNFYNFYRGAPYARIEELELTESLTDGGQFNGAFAGQFNSIRAFQNNHCGLRIGFWDLNGQNWHCEANGGAGVMSYMPGANVSTVRSSYNGTGAGGLWLAGQFWPDEMGANWCECGNGNTITNLRMQESWGHSLTFAPNDPLYYTSGGGGKNAFFLGTFDDTADIVPIGKASKNNYPDVRSMIYMKGGSAKNNTVKLVTGSGQVLAKNYATNGFWDDGTGTGNRVELETPGISNNPADWYAGDAQKDRLARARGPYGTSGGTSIGSRNNQVRVNGELAA